MKTGGTVTIALICGGGCRGVAINLGTVGADVGVYFDVPQEIASLVLDRRVIPVPLAEGHTVGSLVGQFRGDQRFQEAVPLLEALSGDLALGLGQTPALGRMAYELLQRDGRVAAVFQEVLDRVRQLTNGAPERIVILVLGSNSGGTGRGMLLQASRDLVETLRETEAVVVVKHVRIGAQTFNGLGEHIPPNNGVGVVEDLQRVLQPPTEREILYLLAGELSMVGEDALARDRFTRLYLQAWSARAVQEALGRRSGNASLNEPYGRINILQAGFWALPPTVDPMASAAARLLPDIQDLIEDPSGTIGVLPNLELEFAAQVAVAKPASHTALVQLAKTLGTSLPSNYWEQYVVQGYIHTGSTRVKIQGQWVALETVLATLPNTLGSFLVRRSFLFGLRDDVDERLVGIQQETAKIEGARKVTHQSINNVARRLFPKTFPTGKDLLSRLAALLQALATLLGVSGRNALVKGLDSYLKTYGMQEKSLADLEAHQAVLLEARTTIQQKINEHQAILGRIRQWLVEMTQQGGVSLGLFRVRSLNKGVLEDLLLAAQSNSHSYFETAVWRSLSGVTRQGLGVILLGSGVIGADVSPEVLAQRLSQEPPEVTPPWGGKIRRDTPRSLVVIPPVPDDFLTELQQALRDIGSLLQLVMADTVLGGVATVLLRVYSVNVLTDLLTRQYRRGLADAVTRGWYPLARATGEADEQAAKIAGRAPGGGQ